MSGYKTGRREVLATHVQVQVQVQAIREASMMSKERKGTGLSIPTASGPMLACIIDRSYLLWARGIDIPMLKESQIEDGRIRIKPSKTQKNQRQSGRYERIGMKDDVVFRDIRALAATDAARRGENRSDIQKRLVHTSGKTTDIYIKEVIADVSEIPMALPLLSNDQGPLLSDD